MPRSASTPWFRCAGLRLAAATLLVALVPTAVSSATERPGRILFAPPVAEAPGAPIVPAGTEPVRYDGHRLVQVRIDGPTDLDLLDRLGGDLWSHGVENGGVAVRFDEAGYAKLLETGLEHVVLVRDLQPIVDASRAANDAARLAAAAMDGDGFFLAYRELDELDARLDQLVAEHPGMVTTEVIGTSVEGRPIRGFTIDAPGGAPDRPAIAINAACHAREWISPAATLFALEGLVQDYGTDPRATAVLDGVRIHFVPIANPDGYVHSWDVARFWRKTRNENANGTFGTDWNRNFSVGWGGPGSSGNPNSETYRGTEPFSSPEAAAFRDYLLSKPDTVAHLDVHSFSQLVLWPRGYEESVPDEPFASRFAETGRAMADALTANEGRRYTPQPAHQLYLASGIATDWAFEDAGVLSWTLELRPGSSQSGGFVLPPDQIVPNGTEVRDAIEILAEAMAQRFVVRFPDGLPDIVDPLDTSAPARIRVRLQSLEEGGIDPATARLRWRVRGEDAFTDVPLVPFGGDRLAELADLPCGAAIEYAIVVDDAAGATRTWPRTFPQDALAFDTAATIVRLADDFEQQNGWTVQTVLGTDGVWQRGVPADDGADGDPVTDFDGSGSCWLTGNRPGNSDVDEGPTRLLSPAFDVAGMVDPRLRYAGWLRNDDLDDDRLAVEVSTDGGLAWIEVDSLWDGPGWRVREIPLRPVIGDALSVRVRFSVSDAPNNSLTEAAVDAVAIVDRGCPEGGDVNGDGTVGLDDLLIVLAAWGPCPGAGSCPADLDGDGIVGTSDLMIVLEG